MGGGRLKIIDSIKAAIFKAVQYTYMSNYGKPIWTINKDEDYIREAYNKIVWVYSCVSLIASCVSSVDWCLYRKNNNNTFEITDHPILNLVNTKANPFTSSKDFFDIWSTYLALQGKFYAKYNSNVYPTSLEFLYPHYTKPIPNLNEFVQGFEYSIGGKVYTYESDIILWSKFFDPLDAYNGLSPLKSMSRTIDTENEAVDWNKSTLQNQAVPPGAFKIQNPGPDLSENLRKEWRRRYTGANNSRIPLILDAEKADYVSFGLDPVDMDFINQRKLSRIEICSGFNVPSQLVGDPEGQTYANYAEAQKAFWENTIIPKYLKQIQTILNYDLCPRYADNLYLSPNLDAITALQVNRETKITNVNKLWLSGILKRSESRSELDYEFDKSDEIYITDIKPIKGIPVTSNETVKKNYY
jgi:HK97 family phage portal protein